MRVDKKYLVEVYKKCHDECESLIIIDGEFTNYDDFIACLVPNLEKMRNGDSLELGITYSIPVAPLGYKED